MSDVIGRLRVATGGLRRVAQRSSLGFALNRRRLRRVAQNPRAATSVVRAQPPPDGKLVVALSYDDGPSPANTPEVLELLAKHDAHATFFVVGEQVDRHPELARAAVAGGHELGNHSFSHLNPLTLSEPELSEEFERGADAIERATGRRPAVLRPPYGNRAVELAAARVSQGTFTVLWSIDSGDTAGFTSERVAREVTDYVRSGDIVLLHDGGEKRPTTIAATARILEELGSQGYRFVTISRLLGTADPPGSREAFRTPPNV